MLIHICDAAWHRLRLQLAKSKTTALMSTPQSCCTTQRWPGRQLHSGDTLL